eukprot:TRINITY_DN11229_c0_g1_i2.p1 TRINITY_DN11229_c0_g1~~TRINITY_DN11229_c0_g1_i2.p1  ORF type:complete len:780 (+),score=111.81 TRINITY_DN11229_c0_g1_i2:179-2341(+)
MMSIVYHHHWKNGLWGDTPSTTVKGIPPTDYLLYDSFPNLGFLYNDTLVVYTLSPVCDTPAKRALFLKGCIPPECLAADLAEESHEADSCFFLAKFKANAAAIKTDMYLDQAVAMTEKNIEIFRVGDSTSLCSEEITCIGMLDTSGIPCQNIAVVHICNDTVYGLTKEPPGVQMWSTKTFEKTGRVDLPGVFWWPADDAFATWRCQEKFGFKDTEYYGVVIDDGGSVWVVDIKTNAVCRIPVEDPRRKAVFGGEVSVVPYLTPSSIPYPNPSSSKGLPLMEGSLDEQDPSLRQVDNLDYSPLELVPANVRVCGPCILLWGGKDDISGEKSESKGRAFIQLWRSESSYNIGSTSNDLRCVLHAKYDHLLIAHTDGKRVTVLFHPFFEGANTGTHVPHIAVDIWDANGNGFVCRRIVHDEDRTLVPFINTSDLSPCVIQIINSGPQELIYYISQVIDDENVLSVRQFTTLAGLKEAEDAKENVSDLHSIWHDLNPEQHTTVEPRTRRVSIAVAGPEEKQMVWLWTFDGESDTSEYKILFNARSDSSERPRVLDPFYLDFVQPTPGTFLFRSKPDPIISPMPSWSKQPNATPLISHLYGSNSNHVLHHCPYRGDHASFKQYGQPTDPVVSTKLNTYDDKKGSELQDAAATIYHHLCKIDAILMNIAKKHQANWDKHISTEDGSPLTETGENLKIQLRDALLTCASGILGCDINDFYSHAFSQG